MTQPNHDWTSDPRVPALLAQLRDNPAQNVRYETYSRGDGKGTEPFWEYDGEIAVALKAIRDEYGTRCLDYADADWENRKHVATAWLNSKTVDQLIDDAMARVAVSA